MDCKHKFIRGKSMGEQCKNGGLHNGYCFKHKKAAVPENVAKEVGAAEPKKKYKFSVFRWTINSNTSSTKMSVEEVKQFKNLIGFIFDKEKVVDYLHDRTAKDASTNIDDLESVFHFEVAPTTHALHAHGAVKLKHHGYYKLMTDEIREIVGGVLGKKVHVNVRGDGDADKAWDQYMEKNQAARI